MNRESRSVVPSFAKPAKLGQPQFLWCWQRWASPQAREALLDGLHHLGGIAAVRLPQQQVQVLGHDHIAHDHEVIPAAHAFENFQQQIAILRLSQ